MSDIHVKISQYKGIYGAERLNRKPLNPVGLLSFNEPLAPDLQVVFWYPKELSYDTARWLAKDFAVDIKRDLANSGK